MSYSELLSKFGEMSFQEYVSEGISHSDFYGDRDDFNFHISNFPFLNSNIPSSPAYGSSDTPGLAPLMNGFFFLREVLQ